MKEEELKELSIEDLKKKIKDRKVLIGITTGLIAVYAFL